MKFDPTVNMGTVLTIVSMLLTGAGVYSALRSEQVEQKVKVQALEIAIDKSNEQTRRDVSDIKGDVKELRLQLGDIKESLAILRGRASETGSKK
jgi:polyhydroxyalkanoate synthesis regulator phasin